MNSAAITTEIDDDPRKYLWFAVYVLIMAVAGSLLTRFVEPLWKSRARRRQNPQSV